MSIDDSIHEHKTLSSMSEYGNIIKITEITEITNIPSRAEIAARIVAALHGATSMVPDARTVSVLEELAELAVRQADILLKELEK